MTTPERIRATRMDSDITQAYMAHTLKIPQQQYSRYETGRNEIPTRYLVEICRILNVSADYLLGLPKGLPWPR